MSIRKRVGIRLLLPAVLAAGLVGCGSRQLGGDPVDGGQPFDPGVSPGTVTFRLSLPSTRTFCDQVDPCSKGPVHFSFVAASGALLWPNLVDRCPTFCSDECIPTPCPAIPCGLGSGVALTGDLEATWDGSHYESAICGINVGCARNKFVAPGNYLVEMCATPGTLKVDETTGVQNCAAMGRQECVAVPFAIPGPTVTGSLPP